MTAAVLYIDDERDNLEVVEALCDGAFSLLTAESGELGLELLRRQEVGVVLADQRMPGLSGVDVLEATRAIAPDAARILVTAYASLDEAVAAINRGAVERYVRKPWEATELLATLHDALATYQIRRKVRSLERRLVETERVYALGVVAASVAHELRGPLTVIAGDTALMRPLRQELDAALAGHDLARAARAAKDIGELSQQLEGAVQQLIEITRGMELGQRRSEARPVDLREVVTLTTRILRGELARRGELEVDIDADVPHVLGSPHRLGQVLLNLLVNAVQALRAEQKAENRVAVRARRSGRRVDLVVEDNGPGIPLDLQGRIFDPFFTTKEDGGVGLGLAISKRIVEELGGSISVTSSPGATRFLVSLPAAAESRG